MFDKYKINGSDNKIIFIKDQQELENIKINGLSININGNNNLIRIELPVNFINSSIVIDGNNNKFSLKSTMHRYIRHTTFGIEGGSEISVGSGMSAYRDINIVAKNGKNIYIGDECMFAREIMVRNNDGHIILDRETGELINAPEDIFIGNNVWVGMRSMILKGSRIPDGCVIGAMSLVNKKFDEDNILIAGVPARKIRSNIEWRREDFAKYMKNQGIL
ncbi:acyltransferase [bacterium]|nr:acyltransferase [bacterium]